MFLPSPWGLRAGRRMPTPLTGSRLGMPCQPYWSFGRTVSHWWLIRNLVWILIISIMKDNSWLLVTLKVISHWLIFSLSEEDHFFANIILDSATAGIQFKLAPTYTIYLAVRFSLSNGYRPDLSPQDKAVRITNLVIKIANLTHQAIHVSCLLIKSQENSPITTLTFYETVFTWVHFLNADISRSSQDHHWFYFVHSI